MSWEDCSFSVRSTDGQGGVYNDNLVENFGAVFQLEKINQVTRGARVSIAFGMVVNQNQTVWNDFLSLYHCGLSDCIILSSTFY